LQFAKEFKLARLLEQANVRKAKGVGVLTVFIQLLSVVFSGKSLNRLLSGGELDGKKDVFYRFMNSTSANWLKFVRSKHNKRDWLAIGTTDLSLTPKQVISLYSRRWNIEGFFKTVKSCLGFARECQSRSFDAIVCSVAVVFTRHMILVWLNCGMAAPETDGQMFFRLFDEWRECTLSEAIVIVLRELGKCFVDFDSMLNSSLRDFIAIFWD